MRAEDHPQAGGHRQQGAQENSQAQFTRTDAIALLRQPIRDRDRQLYHGTGGILLLDDGGGEPIDCFDDVTAVHYFLKWLDQARSERRASELRRLFKLVEVDA